MLPCAIRASWSTGVNRDAVRWRLRDMTLARAPGEQEVARTSPRTIAVATRRAALAATVLGSSLGFIDATVVNVALPALQASLGASAAAVQWVINAYLLLLGAVVLVGGAAADRYGRRRIFIAGIALF